MYSMDSNGWSVMQYPMLSTYPPSNAVAQREPVFTPSSFGMSSVHLSGYLVSTRKTRDDSNGNYLAYALQFNNIDIQGLPPFKAVTGKATYNGRGVVKLSNIPFTVNAQEIVQFINRYAPIPMVQKHIEGFPIHIIMEKPTGKTMDCFVEFPTYTAASRCVEKLILNGSHGRGTKLGSRNVNVKISTQAELMEAIFPRARLVKFDDDTGQPTIIQRQGNDNWSEGFRGYFTIEEIHGVIRFAESPSRSPFVLKAHQRVYECMISTLYKFPWPATKTYTVAARNALFEAAYKQLEILSQKIDPSSSRHDGSDASTYGGSLQLQSQSSASEYLYSGHNNREVGLSRALLFDLLFAALNVPTFSILQKGALCQAAGPHGRGITLSQFSQSWPFQTLEAVQDVHDDTIRFWLELFDTGFDIMESCGIPTGFEKYLVFSRNQIGFPIGEWTHTGAELMYDQAVQVELAVVNKIVNCGRECWARERQIHVNPLTFMNISASALTGVSEHKSQLPSVQGLRGSDDDEVSPRSSRDLSGCPLSDDASSFLASLPAGRNRLNAATAVDFVPGSQIQQSVNITVPQATPMRLTLDTSFANRNTTTSINLNRPTSQDTFSSSQTEFQTPARPHTLSTASASDPSPFSNPLSTPLSSGSGIELRDGRLTRATTLESGLSSQVLDRLNNFSFAPSSSESTSAHSPQATRRQSFTTTRCVSQLESPDSCVTNERQNPIIETSEDSIINGNPLIIARRSTQPALSDIENVLEPSSSRIDFGPVGSTRPSIIQEGEIAAALGSSLEQTRSLSNSHTTRTRGASHSAGRKDTRGDQQRKLSSAELWEKLENKPVQ